MSPCMDFSAKAPENCIAGSTRKADERLGCNVFFHERQEVPRPIAILGLRPLDSGQSQIGAVRARGARKVELSHGRC